MLRPAASSPCPDVAEVPAGRPAGTPRRYPHASPSPSRPRLAPGRRGQVPAPTPPCRCADRRRRRLPGIALFHARFAWTGTGSQTPASRSPGDGAFLPIRGWQPSRDRRPPSGLRPGFHLSGVPETRALRSRLTFPGRDTGGSFSGDAISRPQPPGHSRVARATPATVTAIPASATKVSVSSNMAQAMTAAAGGVR